MYRVRASVLVLAALTLLLAACGGGGDVQSVEIDGGALRLAEGDTATLTANVRTTGTVSDEVEWSSSDEAVASIDADGVVTAIQAGSAELTAVSVVDERRSDTVEVTVLAPPTVSAEQAGEASATVGAVDVAPTTTITDGRLAVTVADAELLLGLSTGDGEELPIHPGGLPRVTTDGSVSVQGSGYAPGSAVDVWFFSEPALLGSTEVDGSGEFQATYGLPVGLEPGVHTLVVEGLNQEEEALSLRVGLEVEEGAAITEFAHCPANTGWYVSSERGNDDAIGTSIAAPLATIQAAVDESAAADVLCVAAGTYAVDNSGEGSGGTKVYLVTIEKPLTLVGPNVGVAGTAERSPEARLVVSSSEADELHALYIQASDVTVDGFYFGTETPKADDPFPDGNYGVRVNASATDGVAIRNNVLVDMNFPIWVRRGRADAQANGFTIERNLIEGPNATSDQGIYVQGATARVLDNVIRDARMGMQIQPYFNAGDGQVTGNDIEAFQGGLWFNYLQDAGSHWTFEDNSVTGVESPLPWPLHTTDPTFWTGIRIETFYNGEVTFEGNRVEVGTANPPAGDLYLVRQKNVPNGVVHQIGTDTELGAFFTSNDFPDFGAEGVTHEDLSEDGGLIQLQAPAE